MTTSAATLWHGIKEILSPEEWTSLQDIYAEISTRVTFDADDLRSEVGNARQRAWQRNIRNVLVRRVDSGEVERAQKGAQYRLRETRTPWASSENRAAVSDYLAMLKLELDGHPYSKAEHRRILLPLLQDRSEQSLEFKYQNISAVLADIGLPYIEGYKPRGHYQAALHDAVSSHLEEDSETTTLLAQAALAPPPVVPPPDPTSAFVPAPVGRSAPTKPVASKARRGRFVDYAAMEARNAALGAAGEQWVIELERARFIAAGQDHLVPRVEWVSRTQGDGLGYDIASFDPNGDPIFIEVKTTVGGPEMPFLITSSELLASKTLGRSFRLYRVFGFRTAPQVYVLVGELEPQLDLEPQMFQARLRTVT